VSEEEKLDSALYAAVQSGQHWQSTANRLQRERDSAWKALNEIEKLSWDSGSNPAPEVVSRIYCIAARALAALPDQETKRHE
jgi:hypothetical protein